MKRERNIFMREPSTSSSIKVLKETIAWFQKQIEPHDCGWMYTTIDGLNTELKNYVKKIKNFQKLKKNRGLRVITNGKRDDVQTFT